MKTSIFLVLVMGLALAVADFRDDALAATNRYRAKHGAAPLAQDAEANRVAQAYADKLAREDKFEHSGNSKYGENLYGSWGGTPTASQAAVNAVTSWYNEESKYNYDNPGFTMATGHFTALVWKNTKVQGIGVAFNAAKKSTIVVANYYPPGNYQGQFAANVGRPVTSG